MKKKRKHTRVSIIMIRDGIFWPSRLELVGDHLSTFDENRKRKSNMFKCCSSRKWPSSKDIQSKRVDSSIEVLISFFLCSILLSKKKRAKKVDVIWGYT